MNDIVKKLAEEKGFDVVVDTSRHVYFKPALDITNEPSRPTTRRTRLK